MLVCVSCQMRGTNSPLFPRPCLRPLSTRLPSCWCQPPPLQPPFPCALLGPASPHGPCLARPSASLLPCASPFARPHLWSMPPFFRSHPRLCAQRAREGTPPFLCTPATPVHVFMHEQDAQMRDCGDETPSPLRPPLHFRANGEPH